MHDELSLLERNVLSRYLERDAHVCWTDDACKCGFPNSADVYFNRSDLAHRIGVDDCIGIRAVPNDRWVSTYQTRQALVFVPIDAVGIDAVGLRQTKCQVRRPGCGASAVLDADHQLGPELLYPATTCGARV